MPKGLPASVKNNLEKCRSAAIAAVDNYNRPGTRFRTAQFIILVVLAWSALFHAIFYKRRRRPWFRKKTTAAGQAIRYVKIDGEPKHWDLAECLNQFYGDKNPPERKNLEFLLGIRNKIEHRFLPELDPSLFGECQAALLNLEELLNQEFGQKQGLAESLAISLQLSQFIPPEKKKAAQVIVKSTTKSVTEYIEKFRGRLPSTVLSSMKYSFNIFLVPRVANRMSAADAAVEFIKIDEASPEELSRLERLNVLIKEKHIPIANLDFFRPFQVVEELQQRLPYVVNMNVHTAAWKHFSVRPAPNAQKPEQTKSEYCVYDGVHFDYLYTRAWIEKLAEDLAVEEGFTRIVGRSPVTKK